MKPQTLLLVLALAGQGMPAPAAPPAQSDSAVVTVDRNADRTATHAFKFARVPSPVADDAAAKAKRTIVDGEADPNGSVTALTDGILPRDEDEPGANFFFDAGTAGGAVALDLGSTIDIAQINTYSWHPNTRGPQIYTLYASDGTGAAFNAAPKHGTDPAGAGWTRLADVNTVPKGDDLGGQYGVSITDRRGSLGRFRYLLFVCVVTETLDDYGNTFYSEIDVIARASALQNVDDANHALPRGRDQR